jgi:chromosome partitioning protein
VINAANERTVLAQDVREEVAKYGEIAPVVIGNRVRFPLAGKRGETVLTLEPDGPSAGEIKALWKFLGGGRRG